jgi:Ca2+/H+ antiporter
MATLVQMVSYLFLILTFLAGFVEPVAAFDGGDAVALILGLVIGVMGICACLGAYARKQQG